MLNLILLFSLFFSTIALSCQEIKINISKSMSIKDKSILMNYINKIKKENKLSLKIQEISSDIVEKIDIDYYGEKISSKIDDFSNMDFIDNLLKLKRKRINIFEDFLLKNNETKISKSFSKKWVDSNICNKDLSYYLGYTTHLILLVFSKIFAF